MINGDPPLQTLVDKLKFESQNDQGRGLDPPLCYFCDKPIKQGYKVCEGHYQRNVDMSRAENTRQARKKMIREGILY